jgi:hypothetical protein
MNNEMQQLAITAYPFLKPLAGSFWHAGFGTGINMHAYAGYEAGPDLIS